MPGARDTKMKRKQGSGLGTNTAVELGTWETRRRHPWGGGRLGKEHWRAGAGWGDPMTDAEPEGAWEKERQRRMSRFREGRAEAEAWRCERPWFG